MMLTGAAALVACVAGLAVWMPWRLQWQDGRQWVIDTAAASLPAALDVGDTLTTDASQAAMVKVARIGRMEVTPGTQVKLLDTRAGHHRLELVSGRVRARIWAPPGYFAIAAGASETVDLGCEFEMDRDLHGNGTIHVTSGWIMHRVKGQETLVPAGSSLAFNAERGDSARDYRIDQFPPSRRTTRQCADPRHAPARLRATSCRSGDIFRPIRTTQPPDPLSSTCFGAGLSETGGASRRTYRSRSSRSLVARECACHELLVGANASSPEGLVAQLARRLGLNS